MAKTFSVSAVQLAAIRERQGSVIDIPPGEAGVNVLYDHLTQAARDIGMLLATVDADQQRITALQAERDAYRAIVERVVEKQALAFGHYRDAVVFYNENADELQCPWCYGSEDNEPSRQPFRHEADCPVTHARMLLGNAE
jgi:hypothetical protein